MKPVNFKEANKRLFKPSNMTDEECKPLLVFSDGKECISKWTMNWKERLHCLFKGFVWVRIVSGKTQPPIVIQAEKTVFK